MEIEDGPLRRTKWALQTATRSFADMRDAKEFGEFSHAWQSFLDRLEKIWVKAERECQPHRTRFEPWQVPFKGLRKTDQLLAYLHQARHADQHSIQPTAAHSLGGVDIKIPPKGTVMLQIDEANNRLMIVGPHELIRRRGPRVVLLSIENRGVRYDPPTMHLGCKVAENDAALVAEKGLLFYTDYVRQIETGFFPPSEVCT
jgi:hypothetical protein